MVLQELGQRKLLRPALGRRIGVISGHRWTITILLDRGGRCGAQDRNRRRLLFRERVLRFLVHFIKNIVYILIVGATIVVVVVVVMVVVMMMMMMAIFNTVASIGDRGQASGGSDRYTVRDQAGGVVHDHTGHGGCTGRVVLTVEQVLLVVR